MPLPNTLASTKAPLLLQAAHEYGTPLYLYDLDTVKAQYTRLTDAFQGAPIKVLYAIKANSNIHLLKEMALMGMGADAVSIYEVDLAIKAGFSKDNILFTPNSVGVEEVLEGAQRGVHINIDNISTLEGFAAKMGNRVPVCIRLNPHVVAGDNRQVQTGHIDSKFGISIHQLRHLSRVIESYKLKINGLHMHTGSDIRDIDAFIRAFDILLEHAESFPDLEYIDFGSGFRVPYRNGDPSTPIEELGPRVAERLAEFAKVYGREVELWCEPGKFLVSNAGVLLVKAQSIKQTVSTVFVGVDSGMNHLLRPKLYEAYHHIVNLTHPEGHQRVYSVVGNICETDTLGYDRLLAHVSEGDIMAIMNAGAYGMSMASNYNSRPKPAEVLLKGDEIKLIRRRETLDDILMTQMSL